MNKSTSGFTIVELLIVIVVIAVLAAISVVAYVGVQARAEASAVQSNMRNITTKLSVFEASQEAFPTSIDDCPTPGPTTLCLDSPGYEINYQRLPVKTVNGYQWILEEAYDVTVLSDNYFIYRGYGERTGSREFVQPVDLAPIIDRYGLQEYELSFDVKSADTSQRSSANVYFQNGSGARYRFTPNHTVSIALTESYVRHTIRFTPEVSNASTVASWLAFFGTYDTGNIPIVKNIEFRPAKG